MRDAPSSLAARTIAVTGAGGFLGSAVARRLAAAGATVHAFGRRPPERALGVTVHGWDPTRDTGPPAPDLAVDAVIDCAALLPSREGDGDTLERVNRQLAEGALDLAARTGGRIVYMSSQSVYGRPDVAEIDADTPPAPDTAYGEAKLTGERLLAEAVAAGRIRGAVALRLPAVVGPGAHDNFPATVVGRLMRGETVTLFNPDGLYNAVVGAASVAAFAERLALDVTGFHAVSLASAPAIPLRAAAEAIAAGLGRPLVAEVRAAPHASPTIDPSAAVALGFETERPDAVLRAFAKACRAGPDAASDIATPPLTR